MTKTKKIWLGIFTFLPFVFIFLYIATFFLLFAGVFVVEQTGMQNEAPVFLLVNFGLAFLSMGLAVITSFALMIYYIIHASNNPKFDSNDRLLWILIMVFAHQIGYIIYWYLKIWKEDDGEHKRINQ